MAITLELGARATYTYMSKYTHISFPKKRDNDYIYIHTFMHIQICVFVCIHTYIYICVSRCMFV